MAVVLLMVIVGLGLYTNAVKLPIERIMQPQYAADFSNDRILMGASHNVFVGKVIKEVKGKDIGIGPVTYFEVSIVNNIKGNLSGKVIILQQGGYENGILYTVRDGDVVAPNAGEISESGLLEIGSTYLLATRNASGEGAYYLNSHSNAKKLITKDDMLSDDQIEVLAQNDEKVKTLKEAYKTEILLDVDIQNNTTRNSYESLQ